jgi:hypothetical protein
VILAFSAWAEEAPPDEAWMPPALAAVSAGDEAWWRGDRGTARRAWRRALEEAGADDRGRAAEAMARLRLMRVEGNLAPFAHERRMEGALAACRESEPWCAIALADHELLMPAFTGADPSVVARIVEGCPLVGPAAARRRMAGGDADLGGLRLDGMGRGMRATGRRRPPGPGTWVVGFGLSSARGSGFGGALRLVHPDLGWREHRLDAAAAADSLGGYAVGARVLTATTLPWEFGAGAARAIGYVFTDPIEVFDATILRASAGVAPRSGDRRVQVGAAARSDDGARTLGPTAALTVGRTDTVRVWGESGFGDYTHAAAGAEARIFEEISGYTLALRALGWSVFTPDTPVWRLPYAGGAEVLRGQPTGRWRGPVMVAVQAEVRRPLAGPLHGAVFVDGVGLDGTHLTAGGGLRLVLPPERDNVTRLDVGVGDDGAWGVVLAWGEAF